MAEPAQVVHAALVVVGVVFVAAAAAELAVGDYGHHVEQIQSPDVSGGTPQIAYQNLSAQGQEVFQRARRAPDGTATVSVENRVPDFRYGDAAPGAYVIAYEGRYYRVTTSGGGFLSGVDELLAYAGLVAGVLAIGVGGRDFYRRYRAGE